MRTDQPTYELVARWVVNDPELQTDEFLEQCGKQSQHRLEQQAKTLGLTVWMYKTQKFGHHWQVIAICQKEATDGI